MRRGRVRRRKKTGGAAVPVDAAKTGDAPADAKAADPKKT